MFKLNDSRSYKRFVTQRDEALERIFRNHILRTTDILNEFFIEVLQIVRHHYPSFVRSPYSSQLKASMEQSIDNLIYGAVSRLVSEQVDLRRKAFLLSYASESFIVSAILKQDNESVIQHERMGDIANAPSSSGQGISVKYRSFFLKVKRDALCAVELAALFNDDIEKAMGRVYLSFPKAKAIPARPVLRRVKTTEAEDSGINIDAKGRGRAFDYDPALWDALVDDYKDAYIPVDRSPATYFNLLDPFSDEKITDDIPERDKLYAWELEKEITHDFVATVRSGQYDAAKQNGVDDGVWIAILDQKTCEKCCEWRHGLLTSEIEKKLADDAELAAYCDAVVPPAHFNCRCTWAPASTDLEAFDTTSVEKDFDDWLNSR